MTTLETLKFNNLALCSLPVDNETKIVSRQVEGACFAVATPTPVSNPRMVAYSLSALSLLDLPLSELSKPMFEQYMSGNRLVPGSQTAAHCYCGHQSGYFSGQLGDGAAMYLGEVLNNTGERWEIQLKGAGQTPFSNNRDGRKVLRSSIREFLCCEAMFHLGIPTTRAGCCVTSDTLVDRDKNHTGKTVKERASLVLRIAPTFLRFGSFEIFKAADPLTGYQGPSAGKVDILHQLLDYTINNFFPQISTKEFHCPKERYLAFYKEVVLSTAGLVADWQCVGFCHGVANTDNTSIIGITIDYGPFGFLDYYDPNYISQSYDPRKRNSYKNQPEILKWNLLKLAEALQDVVPLQELRSALEEL
ncbi:protein adenylyltransferase SelO, mitochondrial-like [Montipora capricornis]|uniref:protein adenylyltransferase SelO, mitochondrial-like n=1 Tax=Montipora capricornis TaxID=246305 RepID=UPI0035F1149C